MNINNGKSEFEKRLAIVHELGHALMMYLLTPNHDGVGGLTLAPSQKPSTYPSDSFNVYLNTLSPAEACETMALCCVAGGALEIITMDKSCCLIPDINFIFMDSPLINEYNKLDLIKKGMESDIKMMNDYYSGKRIPAPDWKIVIEKAILKLVDYICDGGGENIFELSTEILEKYNLEQTNPFNPKKKYGMSGDILSQRLRINSSTRYEKSYFDLFHRYWGTAASKILKTV